MLNKKYLSERYVNILEEFNVDYENDFYRRSIFFIIANIDDLYKMRHRIFDVEKDEINVDILKNNYLSMGGYRMLSLVFNLFNDYHKCDVTFALEGLDSHYLDVAIRALELRFKPYSLLQ